MLEELANKAPPHPATFINLGTVYNQLKQYERAESWFLQAVNLKGGTPGREDHWNLGICKKNMGLYDEALPMLERALAEFQEHEPEHPVTIAKLHSTVGGCLHDMGRPADAIGQYQQAYDLYVATVGRGSPLFCSAAEGLAKSLKEERHFTEAFEALLDSFEVHARGDAVHPTPLFEALEMALRLQEQESSISLARMAETINAAVDNLDRRGMAEDGNAGLVMTRAGKVLLRAGGEGHRARAAELLHRGAGLVRQSHEAGEADLMHEIMEAEMLLESATQRPEQDRVAALPVANPSTATPASASI
uniref:MalT-like TPR region domain-containing protein n=1 Tax=Alexandrium andersonii TaxID=327968 RepID=A0A7S2DA23_9DINO